MGAVALFALVLTGCSGGRHADVKVKALHAWEKGRAKNCMLLTGKPLVQGGKPIPDPKEMWCSDQHKTDPDGMSWEYVHISDVTLDKAGEKAFHDTEKWSVPLFCEEVTASELKCVFDGAP